MTAADFVNSTVGIPYRPLGDDFDGFDCWGYIAKSFEVIDGISLPPVWPRDDLARAFDNASGWIVECERKEGAIFCGFEDGSLVHVGRILCGRLCHAQGHRNQAGSVTTSCIRAAERFYETVRYYETCLK